MELRRTALAALAAWGLMVAVAFLLHVVIFGSVYEALEPPALRRAGGRVTPLIVGGQLVLALLMAASYPLFARRFTAPWRNGLLFGLVVGLLWRLPHALMELGLYDFRVASALLDSANHLIEALAGGVVVALVRARDPG